MAYGPVGVIGAGAWGTALAARVASNKIKVLLWTRNRETAQELNSSGTNSAYLPGVEVLSRVRATTDLALVVDTCRVILVALPSIVVRDVVSSVSDSFRGDQVVVHSTKGLEPDSCATVSEVLRQETCLKLVGMLSGPNLAREVAEGKPVATVVASNFDLVAREIRAILQSKSFLVFSTRDLVGVELAGAMASAASLGCGMLDSMDAGMNIRAMFMAECLREMRRLGTRMGADIKTFSGLSGVGDLVTACGPGAGNDYELGAELGRQGRIGAELRSKLKLSEGAASARATSVLAREYNVSLPVFELLVAVLGGKRRPGGFLNALMSSDKIRNT